VASPVTATRHTDRAGLDPDQRAAVIAATTSGDAITVITAPAGTGKTTALGAAARIWADAGYNPHTAARWPPGCRFSEARAAVTGGALVAAMSVWRRR
jgi:hypothetical protein